MASDLLTAAAPSRIPVAALTAPTCAVQHFCIHDGPGIRSTVFFKGCPLSCVWCQNPESISPQPQLAFKAHLCVDGCRACVEACPTGAMTAPGQWSAADCTHCRACVDVCPSQAMVGYGEERSVDELLAELEPEFGLHKSSGGGITFSGGEATMHPEMLAVLAMRLKEEGLHLTLETSGQFRLKGLTEAMVQRLLEQNPIREVGWRSARGLQRVGERYGAERTELACTRALALGARSYKTVARILALGRERMPLPGEETPEEPTIHHENVRGPDYYH